MEVVHEKHWGWVLFMLNIFFLTHRIVKKKKFLTQIVISSMVETKQQNRSKKRESNKGK